MLRCLACARAGRLGDPGLDDAQLLQDLADADVVKQQEPVLGGGGCGRSHRKSLGGGSHSKRRPPHARWPGAPPPHPQQTRQSLGPGQDARAWNQAAVLAFSASLALGAHPAPAYPTPTVLPCIATCSDVVLACTGASGARVLYTAQGEADMAA